MSKVAFKIAIFVSGGGSNMEAIINAIAEQQLNIEICCVVSDRICPAIEKAVKAGLTVIIESRKQLKQRGFAQLNKILAPFKLDLLVLAGYLSVIDHQFIQQYNKKIINIHPSLLPKYSGLFGKQIHQQVVENGDLFSGATVHYVTEIVDGGEIIQQQIVQLSPEDTPQQVAAKVLDIEHKILIASIKQIQQSVEK